MEVTVLTLVEGCSSGGPRTQVLTLVDELKARGVSADTVEASNESVIDEVVKSGRAIVVAADTDAQLRAVVHRCVRILAPPPSKRPDDLPKDRTVPDLPPLGVLALGETPGLVGRLGLPSTPGEVAEAMVAGNVKRTDFFRHDGGGITLDGVRIGGGDYLWRGVVALDDAVLSDGSEQIITCVVANADGFAQANGMTLVEPSPTDGQMDVAVAVPVVVPARWGIGKLRFGRPRQRIEVRRARGRAVQVAPSDDTKLIEDGIVEDLKRKRSWWIERGAVGWYVSPAA
ncbi:hypothetical protein [Natronoglycomyces albus]|uniref:DAGKc domain-containing protein n=1 Tax=Natronoglycomyces albus TaxID=2811108 RepID=A0A895XQ85_9ACTN|nr:hypothetical protein [Natronoglycomyces albus]QSB05295.1 hypothetical protein JQS30_16335 [Natronoglycomyces albus]